MGLSVNEIPEVLSLHSRH